MIPLPEKSLKPSGKRKSKYGNRRTVVDGISFHSALEAKYYANLKLLEKAGEVAGIELQPRFILQAPNGEMIGVMVADFQFYCMRERRMRIVDTKGMDTPLSRWKRKHFKAQYGFEVEVVKAFR